MIAYLLLLGAAMLFPQIAYAADDGPLNASPLSVCDLANEPERYSGKNLRIRGQLAFGLHGSALFDKSCPETFLGGYKRSNYVCFGSAETKAEDEPLRWAGEFYLRRSIEKKETEMEAILIGAIRVVHSFKNTIVRNGLASASGFCNQGGAPFQLRLKRLEFLSFREPDSRPGPPPSHPSPTDPDPARPKMAQKSGRETRGSGTAGLDEVSAAAGSESEFGFEDGHDDELRHSSAGELGEEGQSLRERGADALASGQDLARRLADPATRAEAVAEVVASGDGQVPLLLSWTRTPPGGMSKDQLFVGLSDAFGQLKTKQAIPFLIENICLRRWPEVNTWLKSGAMIEERLPAAAALIRIGPTASAAAIRAAWGPMLAEDRLAVTYVVGKIGGPEARGFLHSVLAEANLESAWAREGLKSLEEER